MKTASTSMCKDSTVSLKGMSLPKVSKQELVPSWQGRIVLL